MCSLLKQKLAFSWLLNVLHFLANKIQIRINPDSVVFVGQKLIQAQVRKRITGMQNNGAAHRRGFLILLLVVVFAG